MGVQSLAEVMTRLIPMLLLAAILTGCSRGGATRNARLITKQGTFPSPSGTFQLVIGSKPESLVDYKIVEIATQKEFVPDRLFSSVMRWAAYWQDDNTLWVHSSDIGLSVWRRDWRGGFYQVWLGERSELIPIIPPEVWDFLPSSLRRQWNSLRKGGDQKAGSQ